MQLCPTKQLHPQIEVAADMIQNWISTSIVYLASHQVLGNKTGMVL